MCSLKNESVTSAVTAETTPMTPVYGKVILSSENCFLPPEKLEKSPSMILGMDPETEFDLRVLGCEFIQTAGILLRLPQAAVATGQVLFQRFYYQTSFVRHPWDIAAMGCVYLASKIEETFRSVCDVINVFHHIQQVRCQKPIIPLILDESFARLEEDVKKAENRILKELGFCVHVKHPYKLIVMYLQVLMLADNEPLVQKTWNYMNDSLRTDVFLRYSPETIACGCIYLSARVCRISLPKSPSWFVIFGVKEEDIIDMSKRILNLYNRAKIDLEVLEAKVEILKVQYKEEKENARKTRNNNEISSNSNTPSSTSSTSSQIVTPSVSTTASNHVDKKRSTSRGRSESPKKKSTKYSSSDSSSPKSKKYISNDSPLKKSAVSRSLNSRNHDRDHHCRKYTSSRDTKTISSKKYDRSPYSKKYYSRGSLSSCYKEKENRVRNHKYVR